MHEQLLIVEFHVILLEHVQTVLFDIPEMQVTQVLLELTYYLVLHSQVLLT